MLTLFDVIGPNENKGIILGFFTTTEATILRIVSKDIKQAVEWYPWDERTFEDESLINQDIINWRKSFPFARSALINFDYPELTPDEILKLKGVDYAYCDNTDRFDPDDMQCTANYAGDAPCKCCGGMTYVSERW
jgi:hypothetical protein